MIRSCNTVLDNCREMRWCSVEKFCLCVILAGAAGTDLACGKVKNAWLLPGMLLGIVFRGPVFLRDGGFVLMFAFFLFRLRMMGAGDGKLMALITGFLGVSEGIRAIWLGLWIGVIWSLCRLRQRGSLRARLLYLAAYWMRMVQCRTVTAYENLSGGNGRHRIPLAVCLAAGVYLELMAGGRFLPG